MDGKGFSDEAQAAIHIFWTQIQFPSKESLA
jgi:hypothetical protein